MDAVEPIAIVQCLSIGKQSDKELKDSFMYELIPFNLMALFTEEDMRKGTKLKFYSSAYFPLPQNPLFGDKMFIVVYGCYVLHKDLWHYNDFARGFVGDMSLATLSISLARLLQWSYNPQLFELH